MTLTNNTSLKPIDFKEVFLCIAIFSSYKKSVLITTFTTNSSGKRTNLYLNISTVTNTTDFSC